jgi:SAM-dependent methyltransferase
LLDEAVVVTSYDALAEVYEWLISDAKLTPAGFAAAFDDVTRLLPVNARVLDCSCGTGQLAVGLAGLGMQVAATDASPAMVRRAQELADDSGALVQTVRAHWHELTDHFDDAAFDMVFCVGNWAYPDLTETFTVVITARERCLLAGVQGPDRRAAPPGWADLHGSGQGVQPLGHYGLELGAGRGQGRRQEGRARPHGWAGPQLSRRAHRTGTRGYVEAQWLPSSVIWLWK